MYVACKMHSCEKAVCEINLSRNDCFQKGRIVERISKCFQSPSKITDLSVDDLKRFFLFLPMFIMIDCLSKKVATAIPARKVMKIPGSKTCGQQSSP